MGFTVNKIIAGLFLICIMGFLTIGHALRQKDIRSNEGNLYHWLCSFGSDSVFPA